METFSTVNPVFVKSRDIPENEKNRPSVLEICLAAEKSSGPGTILGAQNIRGLWRIYPTTKEGRSELLVKGFRMRGVIVQVAHTNPFVLLGDSGEEKPTTKLWIDNLPISVAESEIEHSLVKIGCELRSTIKLDRCRDADKLTRFITGRRFVFITVPPTPLDKLIKINIFTAKLFHREQAQNRKQVTCSRCLKAGHHVSQCSGEIVCRQCGLSGHKRGDEQCSLGEAHKEDRQTESTPDKTGNKSTTDKPPINSPTSGRNRSKSVCRRDQSRVFSRQPTIVASLERSPRDRSPTPKRGRSPQRHSPRDRREKQRRHDDGRPAHSPTADANHSGTTSSQQDSGGL